MTLRGVSAGRIGDKEGYRSAARFLETQASLERSVLGFDASRECSVVVCFYHHVNWWIEKFIQSSTPVSRIPEVEDNNFFL